MYNTTKSFILLMAFASTRDASCLLYLQMPEILKIIYGMVLAPFKQFPEGVFCHVPIPESFGGPNKKGSLSLLWMPVLAAYTFKSSRGTAAYLDRSLKHGLTLSGRLADTYLSLYALEKGGKAPTLAVLEYVLAKGVKLVVIVEEGTGVPACDHAEAATAHALQIVHSICERETPTLVPYHVIPLCSTQYACELIAKTNRQICIGAPLFANIIVTQELVCMDEVLEDSSDECSEGGMLDGTETNWWVNLQ